MSICDNEDLIRYGCGVTGVKDKVSFVFSDLYCRILKMVCGCRVFEDKNRWE